MARVARAETVCQFGEREAVAKERELDLGVVKGGEEIEDGRNFLDS